MAVDLPPPIPPEQGTVQPGEAVATLTFQDSSIQVFGPKVLDQAALQQAIAGADSLSNAIRALSAAYFYAGYPASRLTYSVSGNTVLVMASLGGLSTVQAEPTVEKYYNGLAGANPLTASQLMPRQILANAHSNRAGLSLASKLTPGADGNSALSIGPGPNVVDPTTVRVEVGNPGNRYVGRYFIDFDLRTGSVWGDEFRAIARSGQHGFDDEQSDFFEQQLNWSRVTTWGIFGLTGRYADFSYYTDDLTTPVVDETVNINGDILVGEAYWLYPLMADFDSSLNIGAKIDNTRNSDDQADNGDQIQKESYTSVEVSAAYNQGFSFLGSDWDLDASLAVRKGLKDELGQGSNSNQDYLLYRPGLRLRNYLTEQFTLGLELSGQFTSDTLPEQQQWVLGGMGNLTAALPGVAVGDNGYLLRLVLEAGTYHLGGLAFEPKVFVESGEAGFEELSGDPALADAGVELGVKFFDWLEGSLAYAESIADSDLTEAEKDAADANLFFRLQAKF